MIKRLKTLFYVLSLLLIVNFLIINFQSCQQDFITPGSSSLFPENVKNIFSTPYTSNNISCSTPSCHASENDPSGLNLSDWQATLKGSNNGTMVIPYNGFWSHMISVLNSDTMVAPVTTASLPEFHKIEPSKVSVLLNWINDGAKDKNGNVAFTAVNIHEKGFITNQAADLVAVLKLNDNQVTRLIPVGGRPNLIDAPHFITLSPDNRYFYVSLIQEGYLEKYDINVDYPFNRTDRIPAGLNPAHITIAPDGASGYVTNFDASGTERMVRKFNTSPMQIIDTVSNVAMTAPHGMALSNDGQFLYVTSQIGEYIFKINTTNFEVENSAPLDPSVPPTGNGTGNYKPYQVIISPDNELLYISCTSSNEVRIYNSSDLRHVKTISVGTNPLLMKITNDGRFLFVCNRNDNTVTIINNASQTVQTTVFGVGIQPHGVDFSSDGQYAIIACETQSGFDGHHPQIGSQKIGVSRIIRVSDFSLQPLRLEMASFPAGISIVK